MTPTEVINTTVEELLYLANQERLSCAVLRDDDYGEIRACIVREWALRKAAHSFPPAERGSE